MTVITAVATKEARESKLGVAFTRAGLEDPLIVKLVREDGLFAKTGLRAGMIVDTIQGVDMTWKTPKDAADELRGADAGEVSIIAKCMVGEIEKESQDAKLGISLKNSTKLDGIFISKIGEDGVFAGSELAPGQKVLYINDVECPQNTKKAITLVKEAEGKLTIVCVETDLVRPEGVMPIADADRIDAPAAEEKKDENEQEPTAEDTPEGEETKDRAAPLEEAETEEEKAEKKGLLDSMFSACIC